MEVKNLPERLRDLAETLCGCQWNHPLCSPATCNEAADEIERLRAEVADAHMFAYKALPDRKKREESLCGQIHRLREHIERLRAIVDKLPKTADGVSITPGMTIWLNTRKSESKGIDVSSVGTGFCELKDKPRGCYHDKFYSSKQAAEAAKEE